MQYPAGLRAVLRKTGIMAHRKALTNPGSIRAVAQEPWVDLDDAAAFRVWSDDHLVAHNQINRQTEKYRFYVNTFDFLRENRIRGDYHEFGCHRGRTFRMALTEARRHEMAGMRFLAFDSFQGLPASSSAPAQESWRQPGVLKTSEEDFLALVRDHGIYVDRVRTVPGFYDRSLTAALQREFLAQGAMISLACVDCDLYESAVPVFNFIEPLLQEGSVIYIDDLFAGYKGSPAKGVARAFLEFQSRTSWHFVRHLDIGWWGRSYIAYSGNALKGVL
jgi:hypothetical protein